MEKLIKHILKQMKDMVILFEKQQNMLTDEKTKEWRLNTLSKRWYGQSKEKNSSQWKSFQENILLCISWANFFQNQQWSKQHKKSLSKNSAFSAIKSYIKNGRQKNAIMLFKLSRGLLLWFALPCHSLSFCLQSKPLFFSLSRFLLCKHNNPFTFYFT